MFRDRAVDSVAAADRINQVAPIVSARLWLLVAGGGVLCAALLGWGFLGRVPLTVRGTGILIEGTMVVAAESPADGRIAEVRVKPGDVVQLAAGRYELVDFPAERFEVTVHAGGSLTWSREGRQRRDLVATSARELVSPDSGMRLALPPQDAADGPAAQIELRFPGGLNLARRIAEPNTP